MTVCAVVKLRRAIVAIADGRLISGANKSFDTTDKIVPVRARYRIPRISRSRFSHFEDHVGSQWYAAYAGTYALCSQIIEGFRNRMINLYLVRNYERRLGEIGAPYITSEWKRADSWDDNYNFRPDELLKFDRSIVKSEFLAACQSKANEWMSYGKPLDSEFLVFGRDDLTKCYSAFRISADEDRSLGIARVRVEEVKQDRPVAIGEPQAVSAIVADATLAGLIQSSVPLDKPNNALGASLQSMEPSRTVEVEKRLIELVKGLDSQSIGGTLTVASARGQPTFKMYRA